MRRRLWIVPLLAAVAWTAYLFARPAAAPADPYQPVPTNPSGPAKPLAPVVVKPEAPQVAAAPAAPQLPITQVVLYSSGVGYFQRDGQVEGNARVDLTFPTQDVNDLLKSMVLQDLGGGHVSAVSFDSHDPLDKTLNSFAIQLAGNPTFAKILNQARGEKVEITWTGHDTLQGTLLGVETKGVPGMEDHWAPGATRCGSPVVTSYYGRSTPTAMAMMAMTGPTEMLNLWCADGMHSIPLAEVQRVKFQSPALENEVQRALQVLAASHDADKKAVSLNFSGTGSRKVRVGYVVETPLWRTTYRMLVGKDGKLFVQGWAIVQNPTNEDWKDVRMALVSGRPISFKMDLYQPLYTSRPTVQPALQTAMGPTNHFGNGQFTALGTSMEKATPYGGLASQAVPQPQAMSGSWQANPGLAGQSVPAMTQPQAPVMNTAMGAAQVPQSQAVPQLNLERGIVADTTATDSGDSFQYAIEHTVNVPRQKSALLPIVNKALEGDKVSLYSPQTHAKHPLLALRLKNTTGVHLMQGPVAVFDGNSYAGDSQLPDLRPGEQRLVSYALDLGTEVQTAPAAPVNRLVNIRLHKGALCTTSTTREAVTYTVKNRSPNDRVVLVEHAERGGYRLVSEQKPREKAPGVYRFEVKVAAGKTAKLDVVEDMDFQQQVSLTECNVETTRYYLECEFSNAKVKTALEKLLQLQEKVMATRRELAPLHQQLANLTREQERLRTLLKETPPKADAYQRYLKKFDTQETALERLQKQIEELEALAQKQHHECAVYASGLDVEAKIEKAPKDAAPTANTYVPMPSYPYGPPAGPPVMPCPQAYPPIPSSPAYPSSAPALPPTPTTSSYQSRR
jgi:hypothetical protein